jgi:hypothetical protein
MLCAWLDRGPYTIHASDTCVVDVVVVVVVVVVVSCACVCFRFNESVALCSSNLI